MENHEVVIGLEVHVELSSRSKLFCGCPAKFGSPPNTQVCPVCSGMPGALPVLNGEVINSALKTACAFNCEIPGVSIFARKNYFYPDLPKNYQISQYEKPLATDGCLILDGKKIRIKRVHIEEDAGKLLHSESENGDSLVDLNRSGIPLLEIVTEPDIRSSAEAEKFLNFLKQILEYLEISDCNMEEGSLRCDANISVREAGNTRLGAKAEIKNMNSFKAVRKAIDYEAVRQLSLLNGKEKIKQETRLWNEEMQVTEGMRTKEEAHDYRYFPDPDLTPLYVGKELVERLSSQVGELPSERKQRFMDDYLLSEYDASTLTAKKGIADYFEKTALKIKSPKTAANWIMGDLAAMLKENRINIEESPVAPECMAGIILLLEEKKITVINAREVLRECFKSGKNPEDVVREKKFARIQDGEFIGKIIEEVLAANPKAAGDYKNGKQQAMGYLVGQVMKRTKGTASPEIVTAGLLKALKDV